MGGHMQVNEGDRARVHSGLVAQWINRALLIAVFFGILALPVLWFGRPSFVPALQENRRLEAFPSRSLYWFQHFERWFNDRYGMRDALVYYGSRLQMARTGIPMQQDVVIGKDGWLFYDEDYTPGQAHFADLYGRSPLSQDELVAMTRNLLQVRDRLRSCGIAYYLVIAPDKQTIYPETLQMPVPAGTQTRADQLLASARDAGLLANVIDLRPPLRAAKAAHPFDLYKRTDSHWNTLGAFIGYQAIRARLVEDGVLEPNARADLGTYRVSRQRFEGGDIAVNLLSLPNYFEDYVVTLDSQAPRQATAVNIPGWPPTQTVDFLSTQNPTAKGELLLYRDSFSGELMPFFAEDFYRMYAVLGHQLDGANVAKARPRVVLQETVERKIPLLRDEAQNLDSMCKR